MGRSGVNEVIVDSWCSGGGSWGPQLFDGQSGREGGEREEARGESAVDFSLKGAGLMSIFQPLLQDVWISTSYHV